MAREYQGDVVCSCGREVPAYLTGGGMLTTSCGWCRKQVHCPTGSNSYRHMKDSLKNGVNPEIAPPKPTTAKKPAPTLENKHIEQFKPAAPPMPPNVITETKEKTIFDIFNKG